MFLKSMNNIFETVENELEAGRESLLRFHGVHTINGS